MKKVGYFFLAFVPLGLVYLFQFGLGLLLGLTSQFTSLATGTFSHEDYAEMMYSSHFSGFFGICFGATCAVVFGLWYYYFCGGEFKPNCKQTFNSSSVIGTILMAPGVQLIAGFMMIFMAIIFPQQMESYTQLIEDAGLTGDTSVFAIVYAVIFAPIGEELIFRGVTMRYFRRALPFWLANLLQAVLFGVFHGNLIQGIYTAVFALILGFVCEYGGSIYYSILMHFAFNLWGTAIQDLISDLSTSILLLIEAGMFVALISGAILFLFGQKKLHPNHHLK